MDELRRIDLNLLLTLHALLVEAHVSRATVRLARSQPAVSHGLAQLRAHLDDPLLVRRGGRMELTNRARQLLPPLEKALDDLDALLGARRFDPASYEGRIRLSLSDYASRLVLPDLVRRIRRSSPGVDLSVSQGSRDAAIAQLLDGEIDLALGIYPDHPPEVLTEDLFEDGFVCVVDAAELPASGALSFDDWLLRPHAMLALRPDAMDEIERTLAGMGLSRRLALVLPHWGAALDAVTGTDLVLTVAGRAAGGLDARPTLRRFDPPIALRTLRYQQAWHTRRDRDPAHSWLRGIVRDACAPVDEAVTRAC